MIQKIINKIRKDQTHKFNWHQSFEVYRCSACGYITSAEPEGAIGTAHAHAEKHTGFFSFGNFDKLDQYIHKIKVTDFEDQVSEDG